MPARLDSAADAREDRAMIWLPDGCARRGAVRANGLAVLLGIVVLGLVTGAGFYRSRRNAMNARLERELAAVPETQEERLDLWLRYSGPQIHHRLAVVGRFTPERPWLVTHAVARADGPPELWGIDCGELTPALARREGMRVVVDVPAAREQV